MTTGSTCEVLGHPPDGPALHLDHEDFAYAGKFVMTSTGKAVLREEGTILAAVAFNRDRTDESVAWLRYLTVKRDRQGEEIGPRLARFIADRLQDAGATRVQIAVNNPYAYVACYKAGFTYTGRETGIAEVVLQCPPGSPSQSEAARDQRFRAGLDTLLEGEDRPAAHRAFVADHRDSGPPHRIETAE